MLSTSNGGTSKLQNKKNKFNREQSSHFSLLVAFFVLLAHLVLPRVLFVIVVILRFVSWCWRFFYRYWSWHLRTASKGEKKDKCEQCEHRDHQHSQYGAQQQQWSRNLSLKSCDSCCCHRRVGVCFLVCLLVCLTVDGATAGSRRVIWWKWESSTAHTPAIRSPSLFFSLNGTCEYFTGRSCWKQTKLLMNIPSDVCSLGKNESLSVLGNWFVPNDVIIENRFDNHQSRWQKGDGLLEIKSKLTSISERMLKPWPIIKGSSSSNWPPAPILKTDFQRDVGRRYEFCLNEWFFSSFIHILPRLPFTTRLAYPLLINHTGPTKYRTRQRPKWLSS